MFTRSLDFRGHCASPRFVTFRALTCAETLARLWHRLAKACKRRGGSRYRASVPLGVIALQRKTSVVCARSTRDRKRRGRKGRRRKERVGERDLDPTRLLAARAGSREPQSRRGWIGPGKIERHEHSRKRAHTDGPKSQSAVCSLANAIRTRRRARTLQRRLATL